MYKIISDGKAIALCDEPRYIRLRAETGAYVRATQENAQGIAVIGEPYNLPGHTEITRVALKNEETGETETVTAPEAYVVEVDGGEISFRQDERIAEVDETSTTGLMAVTDLYEELLDKGVL